MPDHFATLAQPRRPWLEAAAIKDAFHRASATQHPDAPEGDKASFAALNEAWRVLADPAARLRHLLALEFPAQPAGSAAAPPALTDRFLRIAGLRQTLDAFLRREKAAPGALGQALLAGERGALERECRRALADLEALHERLLEQVRAIDAVWEARDATTGERLAAVQEQLAFLGKWSAQLRESIFSLGG